MTFDPTGPGVFVIAEIGSNHNGDYALAETLVREAAATGVDAVKFQRYNAERLVHKDIPTMAHVRGIHRTQRERMLSLQFNAEQWRALAALAAAHGVAFMASAFDEASADALDPLVRVFKIASGDLTHLPLIAHVAAKGKPLILSTGMASEDEIAAAAAVVPEGRLTLLYCVSRYPTPAAELDLQTIPWLAGRFGVPVGYSDHTLGITAAVAAVALGAVVVEKHFTIDKSQPIGDHKLSAEPAEMRQLVEAVREARAMRGEPRRQPREAEVAMRRPMRRSLHARVAIAAGTRIGPEHVAVLRPEQGLPPSEWPRVLGRVARRDIAEEAALTGDEFGDP